jgi:hypothetical protein
VVQARETARYGTRTVQVSMPEAELDTNDPAKKNYAPVHRFVICCSPPNVEDSPVSKRGYFLGKMLHLSGRRLGIPPCLFDCADRG